MHKNDYLKKLASAAMYVNGIQIIMMVSLLIYLFSAMVQKKSSFPIGGTATFLGLILLSIIMNCFLTFRYINLLVDNNKTYRTLTETNDQLEGLNNTLRSQRHDFMNHLQVVYSLMELEDYKEAQDYIQRVYGDIQKVNRALRTGIPAVNALIQAKLISAEKNGITVRINITTSLNKLIIPAWEFCRILGNLIDNSIFALGERGENQYKELCIELYEDLQTCGFRIRNNGPMIPKEIIDRVFDSGFTTKKEKGEGMGLAITKEILQQYHGEVRVFSNDEFTEFEGILPKAAEQTE